MLMSEAILKHSRKYEPLNREQNIEKIRAYKAAGDGPEKDKLRDEIVFGNARLVHSIVDRLASHHKKRIIEDLQSEAFLSLLNSIEHFDPDLGFAFSTFAMRSILWRISRFRDAQCSVLHIPANRLSEAMAVIAAKRDGLDKRKPTADGRRRRSLTLKDALAAIDIGGGLRIDASAKRYSDDGASGSIGTNDIKDFRTEDHVEATCKKEEIGIVLNLVKDLQDREKKILLGLSGIGREKATLQQLGDELGISKERVRQISTKAKKIIREKANGAIQCASAAM